MKVNDLQHTQASPVIFTVETIDDVFGRSPKVSNVFSPFPGFVCSPFTNAEDHWAPGFINGVSH
ncbi:hypothetical protein D3C86_2216170 [compost metagenome]